MCELSTRRSNGVKAIQRGQALGFGVVATVESKQTISAQFIPWFGNGSESLQ